jgi:putative oxidoreductase
MRVGRFFARLFIGGLFFGHGAQKLFGWFGGSGLDGTAKAMDLLGMKPGRRNAIAAGASEAGGGALIAAGALTPAAAAALIGTMITAVRKVHLAKGFWSTEGGYEFNLTLIAALLVLVDEGPGPLSVDRALGIERKGAYWTLLALAAGAAGSAAAVSAGKRAAEAEPLENRSEPSSIAPRRIVRMSNT